MTKRTEPKLKPLSGKGLGESIRKRVPEIVRLLDYENCLEGMKYPDVNRELVEMIIEVARFGTVPETAGVVRKTERENLTIAERDVIDLRERLQQLDIAVTANPLLDELDQLIGKAKAGMSEAAHTLRQKTGPKEDRRADLAAKLVFNLFIDSCFGVLTLGREKDGHEASLYIRVTQAVLAAATGRPVSEATAFRACRRHFERVEREWAPHLADPEGGARGFPFQPKKSKQEQEKREREREWGGIWAMRPNYRYRETEEQRQWEEKWRKETRQQRMKEMSSWRKVDELLDELLP